MSTAKFNSITLPDRPNPKSHDKILTLHHMQMDGSHHQINGSFIDGGYFTEIWTSILVLCGALMGVNEAMMHNIHAGLVALCYAGLALSSLLMVSIVSAENPELKRVLVQSRS